MNESSKTRRLLPPEVLARLQGRGIDVGCGNDPVRPDVERFDVADGDAARLGEDRGRRGAYDYVYSSHCLEHLADPREALRGWWGLVRPGGTLVVVVPDEDLYEQGFWPSAFNPDHRATFTVGKARSWSPVSHDLLDLGRGLPGAEAVTVTLLDAGYDRRRRRSGAWPRGAAAWLAVRRFRLARRRPWLLPAVDALCRAVRAPVDQTLGDAVAQLLLVARKARETRA